MGDSLPEPDRPLLRRLATPRALIAALVVAYVLVRMLYLRADPPFAMFHGWHLRELLVEPVAKASEARNFGLFGTFKPNPADNYGFWRPQSPVWVYSLGYFFRIFGAGYAPLRIYATLVCAAGFAALLDVTHRRLGALATALVGVFIAFDHVGILYERSGLLEPVVGSLILIAYNALDRARAKVTWLFAVEIVAFAAFFVKPAAVVSVVPIVVGSVLALIDARGVDRPRLARGAVLGAAVVLSGVLAYLVTRPEYHRVLTWDYGNVMLGRSSFQSIDLDEINKDGVTLGILKERLGVAGRIFLVTGPLALIEVGRVAVSVARRRPVDRARLVFAVHVVSTLAIVMATKPTNVRFLLLFSGAFAFLAASLLTSLYAMAKAGARPALRWAVLAVPLGFLSFHAYEWGVFASESTYRVTQAAAMVKREIRQRPDAVVVGFWSAPIVFDTPYQHYYMKPGFNDTRRIIDQLKPTHFLFFVKEPDLARDILKRRDPVRLAHAVKIKTFTMHHRQMVFLRAAPVPEAPDTPDAPDAPDVPSASASASSPPVDPAPDLPAEPAPSPSTEP